MSHDRQEARRRDAQMEGAGARHAGIRRESAPFIESELNACWQRGWDIEDDYICLTRDLDRIRRGVMLP